MTARETVLGVLLESMDPDDASNLARSLGEEIRSAVEVDLRAEHEADLDRARSVSFDIGVRASLQNLTGQGRITPDERDRLTIAFGAAVPSVDLVALHDDLVPILGPGNDDGAAISQADAVVELVRARLP